MDDVENLVFDSLMRELASPDQIGSMPNATSRPVSNRTRTRTDARIAAIVRDNDRLLDLLMKGIGEQDAIDARMKAQGRERDELKQELASLPVVSNIILHLSAIKALADKLTLRSPSPLHRRRAKLEATLHLLDDMGELGPIVRELIRTITLYRGDDDDQFVIEVVASLVPFLQEGTATSPDLGIVPLVAEEALR